MTRVSTSFLAFFSVMFSIVSVCSLAQAGDFAERKIYGFSLNGGLFAFEECGVQDGSGFPYANLYVVDTATDSWTAGSPFKVRLDDETKTVFDARAEVKKLAGTVLKSFEDRGNIVATNRATEMVDNPKRMAANPRLVVPPIDQPVEFRLENIPMQATGNCSVFEQNMGFRLKQIGIEPDQSTRILHEDNSVPTSRNCPSDYQFADIVTYFPDGGQKPIIAVLILMQSVGFEGPNGRYIAVTTSSQ